MGFCSYMLAGILAAGGTAAAERISVYRDGVAHYEAILAARVDRGQCQIPLPPDADPRGLLIDAVPPTPTPTAVLADVTGPLAALFDGGAAEGLPLRVRTQSGETIGRLLKVVSGDNDDPAFLLSDAASVRRLPFGSIAEVSRASPPVARIAFAGNVAEARLSVSAFIRGIAWQPTYRLDLGPDGKGRLRATAVLSGALEEDYEARSWELVGAAMDDAKPSTTEVAERVRYPLGAFRLPRATRLLRPLFDVAVTAEEQVLAELDAAADSSPRVRALYTIQNPTDQAWPAGEAIVRSGLLVLGVAELPAVGARQTAEVAAGSATGIEIRREESELERRQAAIQGENEPVDSFPRAGSITVTNRRTSTANVQLVLRTKGVGLAASDDGKISRVGQGSRGMAPFTEFRWRLALPSGQSKRVTYGYQSPAGSE